MNGPKRHRGCEVCPSYSIGPFWFTGAFEAHKLTIYLGDTSNWIRTGKVMGSSDDWMDLLNAIADLVTDPSNTEKTSTILEAVA